MYMILQLCICTYKMIFYIGFQLPEQYRLMSQLPQKKKHKKHKREGRDNPLHETQGRKVIDFCVMISRKS